MARYLGWSKREDLLGDKTPRNKMLAVVALLSCCVAGSGHVFPGSPSWRWRAPSHEEVTLDPRKMTIELGSRDTMRLSFRSDLVRNVTVGFLYDIGDDEPQIHSGDVVAPLDVVTVSANETRTIAVQATKPGHVIVVCNSTDIPIPFSTFTRIEVERSYVLGIIVQVVGWTYFGVWTIGYYPQVITNFKRRSVVGLNFDFVGLNVVGQLAYALFTLGMFWIAVVQDEYLRRHPRGVIPVEVNDVVYVLHGTSVYFLITMQCLLLERGGQRMSWTGIALSVASCIFMAVTGVLGAVDVMEWLDVLYYASYVKLFITLIRCIPQVYMNFGRKSTRGFNIWFALLEIIGGVFSILQMVLIAYNHDDWDSMVGNPTKFLHGILTMLFDVVFIVQHYCLYRHTHSEEKPLLKKANADKVDSRC